MTKRPAILAIDGGGSKFDAALLRRDGTLVGAARIRSEDWERSGDNLHMGKVVDAAQAASRDAGRDPERLPLADLGVYCLSGADLPADDRRIARWLRRSDTTGESLVRNDTFAVLRAGTDRPWGVGVVCGYGTNCSAVAPDGRTTRFPAFGEISGDWGGGFDIGRMAGVLAIRAQDGRGERTDLARLVPAYFGLKTPRQLLEAFYFERIAMERLGELAPIVFRAAAAGDRSARSIVDRQADEVVTMAATAIRRLRMAKLDVNVVLGGGIFRNDDDVFFSRIREGVRTVAPLAQVEVLQVPPVVGAALIGLDQVGASIAARSRLRAALTHERLSTQTHRRKE